MHSSQRLRLLMGVLTLGIAPACSDDESTGQSQSDTDGSDSGSANTGESGESQGDGDGDPSDGDGDPGDGDPGDGDGDPGDGDGDPGDGDPDPDSDMDGSPASMDCDDNDPNNFPGNDEICDGQDNDCDGDADTGALDAMTYYTDMDLDGWGVGIGIEACQQPPNTAIGDGDCNDNDPDAYPDMNMVCPLGQTCKAILDSGIDMGDGLYLIDPDGVDSGEIPLEIWCDMTSGGASGALIINSVNEGTYIGDFGSGYVSTDLLAVDPATTSDPMATAVQAWLDLNNYPFAELRIGAYSDGTETYMSEWIATGDLRVDFGEPGYLLWNDANGYYWCGGDASYTDSGQGQINQPMGAPADCKGHASLGSGWDFSLVGGNGQVNLGLTVCGGDANIVMYRNYGNTWISYPNPGAAYVIWTR